MALACVVLWKTSADSANVCVIDVLPFGWTVLVAMAAPLTLKTLRGGPLMPMLFLGLVALPYWWKLPWKLVMLWVLALPWEAPPMG